MFCGNCGTPADGVASVCVKCGSSLNVVPGATPPPPSQVAETMKAASADAAAAFKILAKNPIGGLADAYKTLGASRARGVGIAFAVVFSMSAVLAVILQKPGFIRFEFADYLKLFAFSTIPFVGFVGANLAARAALRGRGTYENDVFIAGAAILPHAAALLLMAIVGIANVEVIAILVTFALAYTVLILYAGCTLISGIPSHLAAPAVPAIIIVSIWISSVVGRALIGRMFGL